MYGVMLSSGKCAVCSPASQCGAFALERVSRKPYFFSFYTMINSFGPESLLFFFSSFALASAAMVLRARNPVHAVLYLVLTFCQAAALLVLLGLDFFAMLFLVVYVGAIAVLFLFVIMMLNVKVVEIHDTTSRFLPFAGILGFLFFGQLLLVFATAFPAILSTPFATHSYIVSGFPVELFLREMCQWFFGNLSWGQLQADLAICAEELTLIQEAHPKILVLPEYLDWKAQLNTLTSVQAIGTVLYTEYILFFLLASLILLVAMIGAIMLTLHKGSSVKRQVVADQNAREPTQTIYRVSSLQ